MEQMTMHLHWGPADCGPPCLTSDPSPLVQAVLAAARNGAAVRVLLGDEFIDPSDTRNNEATAAYLNQVAASEGLDLQAKIVEAGVAELVKVHNKGVIIDEQVTYVGSMNWGQASLQDNREVGLMIESPEAAHFWREVFWYDWAPRTARPVVNLRAAAVSFQPAGLLHPSTDPAQLVWGTLRVVEENPTGRGAGDHVVRITVEGAQGFRDQIDVAVPDVPAYSTRLVEVRWGKLAAAGSFRLVAEVDVGNQVVETDETDNRAEGTFSVVLRDLPGVWVDGGTP